jgi:stage III sporulation protein AG
MSGIFTDKKDSNEVTPASDIAYISLTKYENELEQNLADIISSINGAGKTRVLLTMDSTVEQVYATDKSMSQNNSENSGDNTESKEDTSATTTYITVELSDGTQQTVLLKEIQPKVRGVLVVCSGGDNNVVKEKIVDAVTKVLNISSSRVSVAGLTQ